MNELIKSKISWKNGIYKNYQNISKSFAYLEILQSAIFRGIRGDLREEKYY